MAAVLPRLQAAARGGVSVLLAWLSGLGTRGWRSLPVKMCGGLTYCHALKPQQEDGWLFSSFAASAWDPAHSGAHHSTQEGGGCCTVMPARLQSEEGSFSPGAPSRASVCLQCFMRQRGWAPAGTLKGQLGSYAHCDREVDMQSTGFSVSTMLKRCHDTDCAPSTLGQRERGCVMPPSGSHSRGECSACLSVGLRL